MKAERPKPPKMDSAKPRGSALIIVLGALVLLMGIILAFFTQALLQRRISRSHTSAVQAEISSRLAMDHIAGMLRSEIADPAKSNAFSANGTTIYQPITANDILPARTGTATGASLTVFKVSQGGPATSAASANGRGISASRWFDTSRGGAGVGDNAGTPPQWLHLTAGNGIQSSPPIAEAKDRTSPNHVTGRLAYIVYEVGGLLDATMAGHPGLVGNNLQAIKGTAAGANLGLLPGVSDMAEFVSWRNPGLSGSAYTSAVSAGLRTGFAEISGNNRTLVSRRDLIRLARAGNHGLSGDALAHLTHFSRELNAPNWGPSTPAGSTIDYAANAHTNGQVNRFLPNYRSDTAIERLDGTLGRAGDPFVVRRFPLSYLAWLRDANPATAAFDEGPELVADLARIQSLRSANASAGGYTVSDLTTSANLIRRVFGLGWDSTTRSWRYIGTGSFASPLSEIAIDWNSVSLTGPGGNNRRPEPNFFQLLKVGVLSGSVGKASDQKTLAATGAQALEGDEDLQILRIGACLIDQADPDNYPTSIQLNVAGTAVSVHGVEDLPYLSSMLVGPRWTVSGSAPNFIVNNYAIVWLPKLFNPHAPTTAATDSSTDINPSRIRVRITSGTVSGISQFAINGVETGGNSTLLGTSSAYSLTSLPQISVEVNRSGYGNFRNNPKIMEDTGGEVANPASAMPGQLSWWNPGGAWGDRACGFVVRQVGGPISITFTPTGAPSFYGFFPRITSTGVMIVLEAFNGSTWTAYDSLTGSPSLPAVTGIDSVGLAQPWDYGALNLLQAFANNTGDQHAVAKWDPRTTRWSLSHGWSENKNSVQPTTGGNGIKRNKPFAPPLLPAPDAASLFGLWPQGNATANSGINIPGADSVWRPNDAYRGDNANPFRNMSDSTRRPVILQRPFRSVGEMGHAFRDTPWQTLAFFDASSGDAGLLDLFSVEESPEMTRGRLNLNTAQASVLEALLSGVGKSVDGSNPVDADDIAADLIAFREAQTGKAFANKEALARFVSSSQFDSADASEVVKGHREAVVRGLADNTQTRTWNLLADVVVQSGRYAPTAANLERFSVEGEQRCWLHLALDRHTGRVIDSQWEPAPE